MPLDPDVQDQLRRVLTSLEMLLPRLVEKVNWARVHAANWRRHSFAGYLEPVSSIEAIQLSDLLVAWSHKKNDRSGRIAYQFATQWVGENLLRQKPK